ncbi:glycosyltransferase [Desulfomicrobium salsuginis]
MNSFERPLLSCVVATYNAADSLPTLLASLAEQDFLSIEVVVQDGASSDATLKILEQWKKRLPFIKACSCRDKGIYDAWNSAVERVTGEWILFLGADDRLITPSSLYLAAKLLRSLPEKTLYMATPVITTSDVINFPITTDNKSMLYPSRNIARDIAQGMALPHQGLFHKRTLFDKHRFNTNFRIAGDYDFLARTFTLGNVEVHDIPLVCMATGGVSSSLTSMWRGEWEQLKISRQFFPKSFPWKILVRLTRSILCALLAKLFGLATAAKFANLLRKLRNRHRL